MEILIDLKNYNNESTVFKRTAARGIIKNADRYLLIFSKYGDYKFPGGGSEKGEALEDTLIREVKEETGYQVIKESIYGYSKVLERRKGEYEDIIEMDSHYFICEVYDEIGTRNLDQYEKEYDYQTIWLTLEEAIEKNRKFKDYDKCPWIIRDTKIMEILLNEKYIKELIYPYIPIEMKELIEGHYFDMDKIGCSESDIFIFDNDLVLKAEPKRSESDGEYQMMEWLMGKLPVPQIVKFYTNGKKNYLLMTKLKGKMACDPSIIQDLDNMARLLSKGLKKLWQVDVKECPRIINLDYKLKRALDRVINNEVDIDGAEPEIFGEEGFETPMALYEYLRDNRPVEEYVLIHGDYCLPNIFFENNEVSGYLDLGYCGIGDKWQDIALAVRSIRYNLEVVGKEAEYSKVYNIFFEELGIEPDEEKIRYYRLLDELF